MAAGSNAWIKSAKHSTDAVFRHNVCPSSPNCQVSSRISSEPRSCDSAHQFLSDGFAEVKEPLTVCDSTIKNEANSSVSLKKDSVMPLKLNSGQSTDELSQKLLQVLGPSSEFFVHPEVSLRHAVGVTPQPQTPVLPKDSSIIRENNYKTPPSGNKHLKQKSKSIVEDTGVTKREKSTLELSQRTKVHKNAGTSKFPENADLPSSLPDTHSSHQKRELNIKLFGEEVLSSSSDESDSEKEEGEIDDSPERKPRNDARQSKRIQDDTNKAKVKSNVPVVETIGRKDTPPAVKTEKKEKMVAPVRKPGRQAMPPAKLHREKEPTAATNSPGQVANANSDKVKNNNCFQGPSSLNSSTAQQDKKTSGALPSNSQMLSLSQIVEGVTLPSPLPQLMSPIGLLPPVTDRNSAGISQASGTVSFFSSPVKPTVSPAVVAAGSANNAPAVSMPDKTASSSGAESAVASVKAVKKTEEKTQDTSLQAQPSTSAPAKPSPKGGNWGLSNFVPVVSNKGSKPTGVSSSSSQVAAQESTEETSTQVKSEKISSLPVVGAKSSSSSKSACNDSNNSASHKSAKSVHHQPKPKNNGSSKTSREDSSKNVGEAPDITTSHDIKEKSPGSSQSVRRQLFSSTTDKKDKTAIAKSPKVSRVVERTTSTPTSTTSSSSKKSSAGRDKSSASTNSSSNSRHKYSSGRSSNESARLSTSPSSRKSRRGKSSEKESKRRRSSSRSRQSKSGDRKDYRKGSSSTHSRSQSRSSSSATKRKSATRDVGVDTVDFAKRRLYEETRNKGAQTLPSNDRFQLRRDFGDVVDGFSQTTWELRLAFSSQCGVQVGSSCLNSFSVEKAQQTEPVTIAGSGSGMSGGGDGSSSEFGPSAPKQARRETACVQPLSLSTTAMHSTSSSSSSSDSNGSVNGTTGGSNEQLLLRSKFTIKPKPTSSTAPLTVVAPVVQSVAVDRHNRNTIDWRGKYTEQQLLAEMAYFERGKAKKREADQAFAKQRNLDSFSLYLDALLPFLLQACSYEASGRSESKRHRAQMLLFTDETLSKCAPSAIDLNTDSRWTIPLTLCHQTKAILAAKLFDAHAKESAASSLTIEKHISSSSSSSHGNSNNGNGESSNSSPFSSLVGSSHSSKNHQTLSKSSLSALSRSIELVNTSYKLLESSRSSWNKAEELAERHKQFFDRFSPPLNPRASLLDLASYLDACISEFKVLRNATGPSASSSILAGSSTPPAITATNELAVGGAGKLSKYATR